MISWPDTALPLQIFEIVDGCQNHLGERGLAVTITALEYAWCSVADQAWIVIPWFGRGGDDCAREAC